MKTHLSFDCRYYILHINNYYYFTVQTNPVQKKTCTNNVSTTMYISYVYLSEITHPEVTH